MLLLSLEFDPSHRRFWRERGGRSGTAAKAALADAGSNPCAGTLGPGHGPTPTAAPRGRPPSLRRPGLLLPGQVPDLGRRGLLLLRLLVRRGFHGGVMKGSGSAGLVATPEKPAPRKAPTSPGDPGSLSSRAKATLARFSRCLPTSSLGPASSLLLRRWLPGYREARASGFPPAPRF